MTPGTTRPEAELESRIASTLAAAFPNIPRDDFVQQRRFSLRIGHRTWDHDSTETWTKSGRADILILYQDRALALIELKRENLPLTRADAEQAQSYANQITPRPPLVVVSNGKVTRTYDSSDLELWQPTDETSVCVARLLENAGKIAQADMRWAVEALTGQHPGVWIPAVRAVTVQLLEEMTDEPGHTGKPFARDLLFSRWATAATLETLKGGSKFVVITGDPLTGKSSVLRELALTATADTDFVLLLLRGSGPGIFQSIANIFSNAFEWTLTPQDVRQWLRRMSSGSGPRLVLAVDGVDPGTPMAGDLEELATMQIGSNVRIVLSTDCADGLLKTSNKRGKTAVGAMAEEIEIGPLGLEEFRAAQDKLREVGLHFTNGAEFAEDYRAPWILRSIYDMVSADPRAKDPRYAALLPPALGFGWIDETRKAYAGATDMLRAYRVVAREAFADVELGSAEVNLAKSNGFVVRLDALTGTALGALNELKAAGWMRTLRIGTHDVAVPTVPAAYLMELSEAVAEELDRRMKKGSHEAGVWLGEALSQLYLSDLIGAQAIRSTTVARGGFDAQVIWGLLSVRPEEELVENSLIAMARPDGQIIHIKIEGGKAWLADRAGQTFGEHIELESQRSRMYKDTTAWMILAQFARLPSAAVENDDVRMDATVLFEICQCPFPLMRANNEGLGHLEHDFGELGRVLCWDAGPVETATLSLADLMSQPWKHSDLFVREALESQNLPLIHRLMIALRTVHERNITTLSEWANEILKNKVLPEVKRIIQSNNADGISSD